MNVGFLSYWTLSQQSVLSAVHPWWGCIICMYPWVSCELFFTGPRPKPGPGQILEIWEPGNQEMWDSKHKKWKFSKSEAVLPTMSARSGFAGKHFGTISCHPRHFSPWTGNMQKMNKILNSSVFLGGPMGPIHPVRGHVLVALVLFCQVSWCCKHNGTKGQQHSFCWSYGGGHTLTV